MISLLSLELRNTPSSEVMRPRALDLTAQARRHIVGSSPPEKSDRPHIVGSSPPGKGTSYWRRRGGQWAAVATGPTNARPARAPPSQPSHKTVAKWCPAPVGT